MKRGFYLERSHKEARLVQKLKLRRTRRTSEQRGELINDRFRVKLAAALQRYKLTTGLLFVGCVTVKARDRLRVPPSGACFLQVRLHLDNRNM